MDSDAVNISRFKSYHHYLDSLIAAEDIRYLQDGELARLIGQSLHHTSCWVRNRDVVFSFQLSWATEEQAGHSRRRSTWRRSRGSRWRRSSRRSTRTRSRSGLENIASECLSRFYQIYLEQAGDLLGANPEDSQMVSAIKQRSSWQLQVRNFNSQTFWRYKDNKEGRMNSLLFVYIETETEKLSGHVDLTARLSECWAIVHFKKYIFFQDTVWEFPPIPNWIQTTFTQYTRPLILQVSILQ